MGKTWKAKPVTVDAIQVQDLLYQALESELGGVEVYRMAVLCTKNEDLKKEWRNYLAQTEVHTKVLRGVFDKLGMDPEATTTGRQIVRDKGKALLGAMEKALRDAPDSAQVVAAECIVDAETKDHRNWVLIGALSRALSGDARDALAKAYAEVEDEEDEHLYHTMGWCRELWFDALGLPAIMPPIEEERGVKNALDAARADQQRRGMLKRSGHRRPGPQPAR